MNKRRVAITGIGIVSPLGNDVKTTWMNLLAGNSGIAAIKQFDASGFPTRIAAEVKHFTTEKIHANKHNRYAMSFTQYSLDAAIQAVDDAGIAPTAQTAARWGISVGSGMMTAEYNYLQRFQQTCAVDGKVDWMHLKKKSKKF